VNKFRLTTVAVVTLLWVLADSSAASAQLATPEIVLISAERELPHLPWNRKIRVVGRFNWVFHN
jgi:hypothetical protein